MKKFLALVLALAMLCPMVGAMAATEYDVTEPITIKWWHSFEDQNLADLNYMSMRSTRKTAWASPWNPSTLAPTAT